MIIDAKSVKTLRDKTGVPMMQCKKALQESGGDVEKAVEILRKEGLATAEKKAGRTAKQGLINCLINDDSAVMVEVNSETDFVSRNEDFKSFVDQVGQVIIQSKPCDVESLLSTGSPIFNGQSVKEALLEKISSIRENLVISRFKILQWEPENCQGFYYIHGIGKIGVLLVLESNDKNALGQPAFKELGKNISMQVAAASPLVITRDQILQNDIDKEREIYRANTLKQGKPVKMVDKIVDGRIEKWYKEVCLVEQEYIRDPKLNVEKVLETVGKEVKAEIKIKSFVKFVLGGE
ncbi:MAG: translation elongation factor Ts [bacterium]